MHEITITRPDDWHLHLRDGPLLETVLPFTARRFARAIVMPNLDPPITTVAQAQAYRDRIRAALPAGLEFEPLMTLFLSEATPPAEIRLARESGIVQGVKLYPAGATTHSGGGVKQLENAFATLGALEKHDLPLLVHGEVTDPEVDIFDREARFIDRVLEPLAERFPALRIVFEHVTTREAVEFVQTARAGIAATVTPQHLLYDRNALFRGGLRPHYYCLPVLKRASHRSALLEAVAAGSPRFFLGTDSAPHLRAAKEGDRGCAGIFSAHAALELYAEAFDSAGALERLDDFASRFGAAFYRLPRNRGTVTLTRSEWTPPAHYPAGNSELVPLRACEPVRWSLKGPPD
ncbi:MAG: dihydroorotase [Gammaproteobacteria bacterium]|nr:dihydroorotase [Gammaproteobacteria bacterium]